MLLAKEPAASFSETEERHNYYDGQFDVVDRGLTRMRSSPGFEKTLAPSDSLKTFQREASRILQHDTLPQTAAKSPMEKECPGYTYTYTYEPPPLKGAELALFKLSLLVDAPDRLRREKTVPSKAPTVCYYTLFKRMDGDSSQTVTRAEFLFTMRKQIGIRRSELSDGEVSRLFDEIDVSHKKQITLQEWATFAKATQRKWRVDEAEQKKRARAKQGPKIATFSMQLPTADTIKKQQASVFLQRRQSLSSSTPLLKTVSSSALPSLPLPATALLLPTTDGVQINK